MNNNFSLKLKKNIFSFLLLTEAKRVRANNIANIAIFELEFACCPAVFHTITSLFGRMISTLPSAVQLYLKHPALTVLGTYPLLMMFPSTHLLPTA
jgi:hypothetical protein